VAFQETFPKPPRSSSDLNRVGASAFPGDPPTWSIVRSAEGIRPARFRWVFVAAAFDDSQVSHRIQACSSVLHATVDHLELTAWRFR
jgi:hypothetical protein